MCVCVCVCVISIIVEDSVYTCGAFDLSVCGCRCGETGLVYSMLLEDLIVCRVCY